MQTSLHLSDILAQEWKPAFGCTEPASVAWASAHAAHIAGGTVKSIHLRCDPRTYKNCYAVGLPVPGKEIGILWALAIGASLPTPDHGLESFQLADDSIMQRARDLIHQHAIDVDVDTKLTDLYIEVRITTTTASGRAIIEHNHSFLKTLERDGCPQAIQRTTSIDQTQSLRPQLSQLSFEQLWELSQQISPQDEELLHFGADLNLRMAQHGCSLLHPNLQPDPSLPMEYQIPAWVGGGVRARMSGETLNVMSLSGSGNKGITVAVPIILWGQSHQIPQKTIDQALAFAILLTAVATHQLGTLSSMCGAANASGIAISGALVMMMGGTPAQVEFAIHNMVGNLAGMICDGAKAGCSMKTMTGVEAAIRSAKMATSNVHLADNNGIVAHSGKGSLTNLGRLAQTGMSMVDQEILAIMQDKLRAYSMQRDSNGIR